MFHEAIGVNEREREIERESTRPANLVAFSCTFIANIYVCDDGHTERNGK